MRLSSADKSRGEERGISSGGNSAIRDGVPEKTVRDFRSRFADSGAINDLRGDRFVRRRRCSRERRALSPPRPRVRSGGGAIRRRHLPHSRGCSRVRVGRYDVTCRGVAAVARDVSPSGGRLADHVPRVTFLSRVVPRRTDTSPSRRAPSWQRCRIGRPSREYTLHAVGRIVRL